MPWRTLTTTPRANTDARVLLALFDQLPALIAYWDADARNVVANAAYVEWFGVDPDQMRGIHISEVLGPEVYAKNLAFIQGALAGQEQLFDRTLIDQSGKVRHTQASYVPDVVDGQVRGFFVLVTDVTPRVEAQRAADEAQALAALGSWELDPLTGEVTWSRELYSILGVEPGEEPLTLATIPARIHPDDRDRVMANIEKASAVGEPYTIDYRIVRANGDEREVVSNGRPTVSPTGAVVRINGTLQDVTESRVAARELARINDELRKANELNSDVIAMLGHDIRTPVSTVRGYLEILDEDWDAYSEDDRRAMVRSARTASTRLVKMVDRILSLAAIDSGSIQPFLETIDLRVALPQIARDYSESTEPEFDIPAGSSAGAVFDSVHLEQILGNLLTNAQRYGAEPVRLLVSATAEHVEIAVTDAGAGVPEAAREALFCRFAKTGDKQSAARGTGFGLYMAAQLAIANGARLTYEPSYAGAGHGFVLAVPRLDPTEADREH